MAQVMDDKVFIITYDLGDDKSKTVNVSHEKFNGRLSRRQFIIKQKCLACNFESHFEDEE